MKKLIQLAALALAIMAWATPVLAEEAAGTDAASPVANDTDTSTLPPLENEGDTASPEVNEEVVVEQETAEQDQAQEEEDEPATPPWTLLTLGGAFSSALIIIGAAYGIGKIGTQAVDAMARQPEVAGNIQTAMIISAALIEGVTFFALIVCLIALFTSG